MRERRKRRVNKEFLKQTRDNRSSTKMGRTHPLPAVVLLQLVEPHQYIWTKYNIV